MWREKFPPVEGKFRKMFKSRLIGPYQYDGVNWLTQREQSPVVPGGFLCDEMGLGKTAQILAVMCNNVREKTLVVVPKTLVSQWALETKRFVPSFNIQMFDGVKRTEPKFTGQPTVVIAPYSLVGPRKNSATSPLLKTHWDRIILDEAHEIRNRKSRMHIGCNALRGDIRWVLTGTPVFNSMKDFISLGQFLGLSRTQIENSPEEVRKTYVLRRTKEDVSEFNIRLKLPPCEFENTELNMYPEEKALYLEAFRAGQDVVSYSEVASGNHSMELIEALLRVRQVMAHPQIYLDGIAKKLGEPAKQFTGKSKKMETLMEFIKAHPKEKALVFCQFIGEMDYIQSLLKEAEIPVCRIDGRVNEENRAAQIQQFKKYYAGKFPVFLIQIKAGGVGLNLQEATRVYLTSPSWNPATELQAIARAHRTGQSHKVIVRKLLYVGEDGEEPMHSVEQSILALQERKCKVCADVLNDERLMAQIPKMKTAVTGHLLKQIFRV